MPVKRQRPSGDNAAPAPKRKVGSNKDKYNKDTRVKPTKTFRPHTEGSKGPGGAGGQAGSGPAVKKQWPKAQQPGHAKPYKGAEAKPYKLAPKTRPQADGRGQGAKDKAAPKPQPPAIVKRALLQDTVQKWEAIRRHDLAKDDRAPLVSAVLAEGKGRLAQLAVSHTGSRVVQACVKFGSEAERAQVLAELRPALRELAKSSYAHFTVTKLIAQAPKPDIPGLVRELLPDVAHLLRHPCGASVIAALWDRAPAEQRNAMAATFYGKEFSVLSQGPYPASLGELLKSTGTALKRQAILQQLTMKLHPIMEKGMVDAVLVHRLLAEYIQTSRGSEVAEAVEQLAGPAMLRMIHTQHGAYVGCAIFAYGTPKDRKKAIKSMKGHVLTIARDGWAHVVLMAALTFTDDTALLRKYILPDLLGALEELCQHTHGSRVLLQLLRPLCPRHTPPQELALLTLDPRTRKVPASQAAAADEAEPLAADAGEDAEVPEDADEDGASAAAAAPVGASANAAADEGDQAEAQPELVEQVLGTSKKSMEVRRAEVLGSGLGSLAGRLLHLCTHKADALLRNPIGSGVLVEVATGGEGGLIGDDALEPLHEALLALCRAPWPSEGHLLEDWYGSRAVRVLCQAGSTWGGLPAQRFASQLWDQVLAPQDADTLLQSHCGKIVHACCNSSNKELQAKALDKFPQIAKSNAEPKQLPKKAKRMQQKKLVKLKRKAQLQAPAKET